MCEPISRVDRMKNVKRHRKLFKFYNELGEKYPASTIIYQWGPAKMRARYLRRLLAKRKPRGLTLDLGCQDGYYAPYIKRYVGLDVSKGYLTRFHRPRVWGYAQYLPFANRMFDRVFMSEMIEHTYERKQILDECYRVLKRKGILIMSVPSSGGQKRGGDPFHIQETWTILEEYGVSYCPYIHGHFNVQYTKNLLVKSRFQVILLKKLEIKKKVRFIIAIGRKR